MAVNRNSVRFYLGVPTNVELDETYLKTLTNQLNLVDANESQASRVNGIIARLNNIEDRMYSNFEEQDDLMVTDMRGIKLDHAKKLRHLNLLAFSLVKDLETAVGIQAVHNKYQNMIVQTSFRSA
jgi:hypothetical protein